MKEYKRLTERTKNNGVKYDRNDFTRTCYPQNEYAHDDIDRMAIRLAELEDKIEQGTLIELPCKVGDTVYHVEGEYYPIFKEYEIGGIAIVGSAGLESIKLLDDCHCDGFFAWASKIGETVFLTREEAEKRLKELQNG